MSAHYVISRRHLLLLATASGSAALLSACGGAATVVSSSVATSASGTTGAATSSAAQTSQTASAAASTAAAAAAPSGAVKTIHVNFRTGSDAEWQQKFIPKFQATNPNIHVVLDVLPGEPEYWAKVQALYATGQVGDFIWASLGNYKNFADKGLLGSLDALVAKDKYDVSDYFPSAVDSMKWNGKLNGLPWGAHVGNAAILYNADMLDKAGIKPEDLNKSYDGLYAAAVKLTQSTGGKRTQFGFIPAGGQIGMNNIIRSYGGEFYDQAGQKLTIDAPQAKDAITWLQKMWKDTSIVFGSGLNTDELFANGQIAMEQGWWGSQFVPGEAAIKGKFKWDFVPMPKGPGNVVGTQLTINGIAMSSITKEPDATWTYMKWLLDPVSQVEIVTGGGGRPAPRHAVLDNPEIQSKLKAPSVFVPQYTNAQPWPEPGNHRWPEFNAAVDQVFGPIWTGQATLDAGMKDAISKLQEILDKPKA